MPKVFNRAVQVGGEDIKIGTYVVTVLEFDASGNVSRAKGANVPAVADKGFAVGCEFIKTDGSLGQFVFRNEGTAASANFKVSGSVAPTEAVTATNVITAAESGKTFFLNSATEFVSTLPAPAAGLKYTFIVKAAPSGASYTVVSDSGTDNIHGVVASAADAGGSVDSTAGTAADTITFVDGQAHVGDRVDVISDGTLWYAFGLCDDEDAITFTAT
jgi:hypothetical protein